MIQGEWKTKTQEILRILDEHETFRFHLTGSRFFGNYVVAADYDFFCENDSLIKEFLVSLGFIEVRNGRYNNFPTDVNTAIVYKLADIDIQLIKSVELKQELQNHLLMIHAIIPTDKYKRSQFWNSEYSKLLLKKELERKDATRFAA